MARRAPKATNTEGDNDIIRYYRIPATPGAGGGPARPPIVVKARTNSYQCDAYEHLGLTYTRDQPADFQLMSRKKALLEGRLANVILLVKSQSRTGSPTRSIVSVPVSKVEEVLMTGGLLTGKAVGPSNRLVDDVRPTTK